jgi:tetratricopeptide (TPR) repeat protein
LAWRGDESAEEQLALLERSLEPAGLKPTEAIPLIAPLLNLTLPAIHAIEHATVLAEKSGSLKQLVDLMISQAAAYNVAGNFQAGAALADRVLELALREGSPVSVGRAHVLQIQTRFFVGDLAGVEKHFMAGPKFLEEPDLLRLPLGVVLAFGVASWSAWTLGRAEVARDREARMMAVGNTNPYTTAWSAIYAAVLRAFLREYNQAEALAVRAVELSEQHQFTWDAAISRATLGDARSRLGRVAEGIALIRRGIAEMLDVGARMVFSPFRANLAAALERQGAILDALATVEQALQLNPDQIIYRPETFRLRGELRLEQGQTEFVEADFREAIALARKMGAKAWELRAAICLARLLASAGRREEARTMLAEIYNWFTEGFDTADLKDAKALMEEL